MAEGERLSGPTQVPTPFLSARGDRIEEAERLNEAVAADIQAEAAAQHPEAPQAPAVHDSAKEHQDGRHVSLANCSLPALSCIQTPGHRRQTSTLSMRSPMSMHGSPRHINILEEDVPQTTLRAERGELAQQVVDTLKSDEEPITTGVNLRDAATTSPDTIINGRVFRSSQVFMKNEILDLKISAALDLRAEPHACKKAAEHNVATGIAVAPLQLLPDRLKLHAHRSLPLPCSLCSGKDSCTVSGRPNLYKTPLKVFHVDLLPPRLKLRIFRDMPWNIRLRTICAPLKSKSPQEVMAPAVADPNVLGYTRLYCMMLDLSMQQIARALRVFAQDENLPTVVHCIHGKDRTGLVIALLLLTLGVPEEVVLLDYAKSEVELKFGRDQGTLKGEMDDFLVKDDVIASSAQTMEDTLRYLDSRYGGIRKYLHIIGITRREVHDIRKNLLVPSEDKDNPDLLSTFSMGSRDMEGER